MEPATAASSIAYSDGRLHARPHPPTMEPSVAAGTHKLAFPNQHLALFHAPANHDGTHEAPLLLLLHGAGGRDGGSETIALAHAMFHHCYLLAPRSLGSSWDMLRGGYGPDLQFLDLLLAWTMQHYAIAPDSIAIAGFSDGASYALSVGLMNGDLFSDILAFSPGFARPLRRVGQPRVFIAHGQSDPVLPVARGRDIAHHLASEGYDVEYQQFDGAHTVPPQVAAPALQRALRPA